MKNKYWPQNRIATFLTVFLLYFSVNLAKIHADELARTETRVEEAQTQFGVTGAGVIIAILDRGIDYEHPDFRNEDGSSRILYIYDLTDNSGATDTDNPFNVGTVYTKAEIDAALVSQTRLATRDAVGHGTTTAGLAGGNGRASAGLYKGTAPNASFIIVKFTTEGAPAHDGELAESPFFQGNLFPTALDFILQKADEAKMPVVALANFGSIGAIADGSTILARTVDERFGAGKPGHVFVCGSSDDGGVANHAAGKIDANASIDLKIRKEHAGNLRLELWYAENDRFDVQIITPNGTFGPYNSPSSSGQRETQQTQDFWYYHNGSDVDFHQATSNQREILIDFNGPVGDYIIRLQGSSVTDGQFHAWLNPATIHRNNRFESHVSPGHTIWEIAAAKNNIAPNSYVLRTKWKDIDGITRSNTGEGNIGDLWTGSGVGPTTDGRIGITVSAPGESLFTPYAPRSYFATFRFNTVFDGGNGGLYGRANAVSAAAPTVTGIIALLLEINPAFDAAQVKDILQQTARSDEFTGETPNPNWGYGKIDALAAVRQAEQMTAVKERENFKNELRYKLTQNYPNPFNPTTTINFELAQAGVVTLKVYDLRGREVAILVQAEKSAGPHSITFDASKLASGVYVYRIESGTFQLSRKLILLQ